MKHEAIRVWTPMTNRLMHRSELVWYVDTPHGRAGEFKYLREAMEAAERIADWSGWPIRQVDCMGIEREAHA